MSWLAATHPAWNAHTEEANTSTQFKLSISLASVSGYRATVTRIDYSGPAKSNYTTHTTDLSLPPPPLSLLPINSPHGILTLSPAFAFAFPSAFTLSPTEREM